MLHEGKLGRPVGITFDFRTMLDQFGLEEKIGESPRLMLHTSMLFPRNRGRGVADR